MVYRHYAIVESGLFDIFQAQNFSMKVIVFLCITGRNRDVVTNRTASSSSETPVQPGEEPVVDLQLQKALEFLREAVRTNPGKVRKA